MRSSMGMGFGMGGLEKDALKLNLNEKEVMVSINNRFANYIEKGIYFHTFIIILWF